MRTTQKPTLLVLALLGALLAGSALAAGPGYPDAPRPEDFRGARFGATLEEIPGLHPVSERMPRAGERFKDVYYREGEPPTLGEANIVSVAYYFRNDRLRSVILTMQGDVNAFLVKDMLITKFGPGRQLGPLYGWTWDDFSVSLGPLDDSGMHALTYTLERDPESE
jgi:hypothetical protein